MNETARQLLSKLIDLNWEINHGDYPSVVKMAVVEQYWKVKEELIEEMGEHEFRQFMEQGRRMFGGYGDESPDEVANMMIRVN